MRASTRSIVTSALGLAVTAGIAAGVPLVAGPVPAPAASVETGAQRVDAQTAALTRLDRLDSQADAAGVAAQQADEALLQHRSAKTEAAAKAAHEALEALAREQEPQLIALARVLGPQTVADGGDDQADEAITTSASSSRAARAVSFARSQKGKPYRFAGSGLGAYDCSGLTMRSYSKVGEGIGGHSATRQYLDAQRHHDLVSYSKKRVGDLIFYGRPGAVYHVAIYSGNGRMIEAPYPGKSVREVPVRSSGRLSVVGRVS